MMIGEKGCCEDEVVPARLAGSCPQMALKVAHGEN